MWKRASNSPQEVQRSCCIQRSWARSQWPAPDQSAGACQRRSSLWWGRSGWGESAQRWEPTSSIPVGFPCFSLQSPLLCSEIHTHTLAYFLSTNYYIVFWNIHTSDLLSTHPFIVFWTTHLLSSLHEILKYTHTHIHTLSLCSLHKLLHCVLKRTHFWSSLDTSFSLYSEWQTLVIFSLGNPSLCSEPPHTHTPDLLSTNLLLLFWKTHTHCSSSLHKLLLCVQKDTQVLYVSHILIFSSHTHTLTHTHTLQSFSPQTPLLCPARTHKTLAFFPKCPSL